MYEAIQQTQLSLVTVQHKFNALNFISSFPFS